MQYKCTDMSRSKKGRPVNNVSDAVFYQVTQNLETRENDIITVADIVDEMRGLCGHEAYSLTYMKKRLIDHFGCEIVISELHGKPKVVTFKNTADSILHAFK